jgi:uncharacterized BrkB/YihY/UPF0761 family membrane protein
VKKFLMMGVVASALVLDLVVPAILQVALKALLAAQDLLGSDVSLPTPGEMTIPYASGRYVLAGGLLFYALVVLYMLAPGRRIYFRQVWLAALPVAIALQAGQSFFGSCVSQILNYNTIYGSVGAIMLALMWVYLAGVMIFWAVASAYLLMAAERLLHPVQKIEIRGDHRCHHKSSGQKAPGNCHGS